MSNKQLNGDISKKEYNTKMSNNIQRVYNE